jgi:hypothetical protein
LGRYTIRVNGQQSYLFFERITNISRNNIVNWIKPIFVGNNIIDAFIFLLVSAAAKQELLLAYAEVGVRFNN